MNRIFDNDAGASSAQNFFEKNKKLILIIISVALVASAILISSTYADRLSDEKAASIYNKWLISSESNKDDVESLYLELVNNHANTGYSMMAMLNKGAENAEKGNYDQSINEIFNKYIKCYSSSCDCVKNHCWCTDIASKISYKCSIKIWIFFSKIISNANNKKNRKYYFENFYVNFH